MSGVKNWLMEMQEYSWHLIDEMADRNISLEQARENFVAKYGQAQVTVLNDLIADNNDEWRDQHRDSDCWIDDEGEYNYGW
tara:strand:- start:5 stop:247 length:243 start_codon:yes stop_codon:yes gene_type:complete